MLLAPTLSQGVPLTLFNLINVPNSNGIFEDVVGSVVLGLLTSRTVVLTLSISYPLTYALPGDTHTAIKSSDGLFL